MKRILGIFWVLLLLISPAFAQESSADSTDQTDTNGATTTNGQADKGSVEFPVPVEKKSTPYVVICPIDDEIDEAMSVVVQRAVKEAENAEALLFIINTPGGRVDSAIEITTAIMSVECPTIAFIEGMGAISAGAIITYSCDYIYMTSGTNIGASTPIMPGVETTEAMDEKSNSFVRAKYRALGEANGHDPILGEAMVDRNMEVRGYRNEDGSYTIFKMEEEHEQRGSSQKNKSGDVLDKILDAVSEGSEDDGVTEILKKVLGAAAGVDKDTARKKADSNDGNDDDDVYARYIDDSYLISARGELLTLTSNEAVHVGLAKGITTDVDDTLREFLLGSVNRMTITPTWEEALFALLTSPTIAGLLLMAGLGGIYMEVRTPGFGAPGIIGTLCLALFFGSHMVLGMASWIDVALIIAGFLLIIAEIFLLPGFGLAGILGFVCLLSGAYLALVKAPIPEFTWEFQQFNDALYTLTVTLVSLVGFVTISGLLIPYTPMGRALVLDTVSETPAAYARQAQEAIGLQGVALSMLRPAGKGRFDGTRYDVVTRGEFIDKGAAIEVIESSGNRYVVTAVKEEEHA